MSDEIENLVLEHLKAIQADIANIKSDLKEQGHRLGRMEMSLIDLRREVVNSDALSAEQGLRIDRLADRVERIERRLELS